MRFTLNRRLARLEARDPAPARVLTAAEWEQAVNRFDGDTFAARESFGGHLLVVASQADRAALEGAVRACLPRGVDDCEQGAGAHTGE